jgi:NAD(P)-dependent dehydrogenase (short-subunit alcohol dehydrogenase family)
MHDNKNKLIALVTGANSALGMEISKQLAQIGHTVIISGRNAKEVNLIAKNLKSSVFDIDSFVLDVNSVVNIDNIYEFVMTKYSRLDILVNNAAIYPDNRVNDIYPDFFELSFSDLQRTIETNFYGPFNLSRKFMPQMLKQDFGRIVNVSSGMGRFEDLDKRGSFYRMSKVALNSLTCILADISKEKDICVNSVCPGWVRSKMGGIKAVRSAYEGARGIVWAATLPKDGPSGQFFRDEMSLDWCLKRGDPY